MDPNHVSIDTLMADLSKQADASDALPVDASETVLVSVPESIAHLVDRESSPHLASGPFSIVRLTQGGNDLAVFARVAKELQWPLTKDQPAVKLDAFHYFFAVTVPREIEEEGTEKTASSENDNLLNYGITFSEDTDMESLKKMDEVLELYCCFKAPQMTTKEHDGEVTAAAKDLNVAERDQNVDVGAPVDLKGISAQAYWTALAPNVEDYSNSAARAIASGAGQIIRGIFWCSETTISQMQKGNYFMQGRIKTAEAPTKISPAAAKRIHQVRKISAMCEQFVASVYAGVVKAAAFIARPLVTSKAGQKLLSLMPGQVALASLEGFAQIVDALEVAGKNMLTTTSTATTGLVTQRYGDEAGQITQHGFEAIGGFLTTAWTISKLGKALYPSSFMKSAAKVANDERKSKDQSSENPQIAQESDKKLLTQPQEN